MKGESIVIHEDPPVTLTLTEVIKGKTRKETKFKIRVKKGDKSKVFETKLHDKIRIREGTEVHIVNHNVNQYSGKVCGVKLGVTAPRNVLVTRDDNRKGKK